MVRATAFVSFLDEAARQLGDDLIGFGLGSSYDLRAEGLAGHAVVAAPTLRAALGNAARYGVLRDTAANLCLGEGVSGVQVGDDVFGLGRHTCLGQSQARSELQNAFDILLARFPDLRLDEANPPAYRDSLFLRGLASLPVVF